MRLVPALTLASLLSARGAAAPPDLAAFDVVWTSPGGDADASMPLGNGVVGANVWVEDSGDVLLLLSRTDAWSETDRLLKLGRVRLHFEPAVFQAGTGGAFTQELRLRQGRVEITGASPATRSSLLIYSPPGIDQIRVDGRFESPVKITASLECWRREKRTFANDDELKSSWTMHSAPAEVRRDLVWESPDVVDARADNLRQGVLWYHRNEHSVVPFTLEHQGLGPIKDQFRDVLIHRTFGGFMEGASGSGLAPSDDRPGLLETAAPTPWLGLRITTHAAQTDTVREWADRVYQLGTPEPGPDGALAATEAWWSAFWDRSWVSVEGDGKDARPVPHNRRPLRIGADSGGGNLFRGWMTRASVYHRALSAAEITRLAAGKRVDQRPVLEGGEISADLQAAGMITDGGAWRAISGIGPSDGWEPQGRLEDEREMGEWIAHFAGGHLRTIPQRPVTLDAGFTLEAWIRPAKDLGSARIFDKITAGGSDGFLFDTHPGDGLRLIVGDLTLSAPGVLRKNEWQHVAATYDAATGRAVISHNGKPVASGGPGASGRWKDDPAPSRVTQAYLLQRWMQACGGGPREGSATPADFPIKFNGSIFTVDPRFTEGQPFDPDWRKWGGCFWWQNTRLPYYPMLASGDFEMMEPLFRLYERCLPGAKARAKLYYGADGVYWPETMTGFGTYGNGDYGWDRAGAKPGDIRCPWWQWAWNQSLELTQLMLDRAAYTGDDRFLRERAVPMARETLRYFDSRFARDEKGLLRITPTQAVETYWHEVVNDAPVVGGLHTICDQLLALPSGVGGPEDRALWMRVRQALPPLPVWEQRGVRMAAPAQAFRNQRSNCETPELYPLWPFREYGLGRPDLDLAMAAYRARVDRSAVGWTQDGIFAARLGLADEAKIDLLARVRNSNPKHRFPASWGPNFDWLPDQDHGSNLMLELQLMLMQAEPAGARRIFLLPAWPREWDVSFKLHAPGRTTVEGEYRRGRLEKLLVQPEARRGDIVLPAGLAEPEAPPAAR